MVERGRPTKSSSLWVDEGASCHYLEPNWAGHPSVRFLDPVQRDYLPFDPGTSVPVTTDSAAIFIGDRPGAAQRIAAFHPGAERLG